MINSNSLRSVTRSRPLLALAWALSLALASVPALSAADTATLQPLADKPAPAPAAPALPLTGTFEKGSNAEGAPLILKLKNNSKDTLKVSAKILLAVVHHATDKARELPEHAIEAGAVWIITDIAADDRVILSASGYEPLEFRAPFKL